MLLTMEGTGLRVAGGVASRSIVFIDWKDLLGRDAAFRRLAGGEPVHLPCWTGSVSDRLAFEYLYCLSTREDGRPRYVTTDRVDFRTMLSEPVPRNPGRTNGTALTLETVDSALIDMNPCRGW